MVAALLISVFIVQAAYKKTRSTDGELPALAASTVLAAPSPAELSNSFRSVAKMVKPAVVHINTTEIVQQSSPFPSFPGFEFGGPRRQHGTGSGVIVSPDGYVLTNNHVVGDANKIEVTMSDGRRLKGTRVGVDPETDLAVIRIDASGLPTAALGDSDLMEQGDWVVALGSPFGLQQTLTAGIVSATGRELPQGSPFDRYLQTDASINPGNSGGPLVNLRGEVVGINTLIFTRSGGNDGIGFAIPSNLARKVYSELIKTGKVTRGFLGVTITELDEARARAFGVEREAGVLVSDLTGPDAPAAKAGLRSGDVITTFNGKRVRTASELTNAVADTPVGQTATVDFIRNGEQRSVKVTIAERPLEETARLFSPRGGEEGVGESQTSRLGVTVQTVDAEVAKRLKLKTTDGAVITAVQPGSAAAEAGLRRSDVIHRIDRTIVKTADDLVQAAGSLKSGDEVAIQVERNGQLTFVTLTLD
jgi:serine protease Do